MPPSGKRKRRLAEHDLHRALGAAALPQSMLVEPRQPRDRGLVARDARLASAHVAPSTTSGTLAPAGTFISARTERISEMSSISQSISASASAFCEAVELGPWREHRADLRAAASLAGLRPQLLGDERHERMQQLEDLVEHAGAPSRASRPSPPRRAR